MRLAPVGSRLALVRLSGELSTKARATRSRFLTLLVANLRDALAAEGLSAEVERAHERLYVHPAEPPVLDLLGRVFGVQSLSLVERVAFAGLGDLVDVCAERFAEAVRGRSFAVRARMVGDPAHRPFGARDLERELGTRLLPSARKVDLSHPEVTARIEVHRGAAHLFEGAVSGPGGLPLGSEGRALALVSGGFDSAVAAWLMLRRGVALDYAFCNLGGRTHEAGTLRVLKVLADRWSYGYRPRVFALDFRPVAEQLLARCEPRYRQVVLKREMLRAATRLGRAIRARALVTGESVGQVSSQTLANLAVISEATDYMLLRPLVGARKDEIIAQAERIGTAALSAVVAEYCALVPRRPATAARLDDVRREEAALDPGVVEQAVRNAQRLDLRAFDPDAKLLADLETDAVPPGATLVDLRTREEFASWHHPAAVRLDFADTLRAVSSLPREREYVLVCEFGLKSAHLAELMREAGLRASHFRGGTRALRRWHERQAARSDETG
ncbi:MAG TPA: THUMP domain-containing protein [Myxococcota bacterium]|nr:THUMP domain-containing protein [Myxococcota bacterium]